MEINTELIRRFLNKECDPIEAEMVAAYLQEHPHLLNEFYNEAEWKSEAGQDLDAETWDRVWRLVNGRRKKKRPVRKILYAAACLLAVFSIGYLWKSGRDITPNKVDNAGIAMKRPDEVAMINLSDSTQQYTMPDSTVVHLSARSTIRFYRNEWTAKRDIYLEGEAVFHVAKDTSKPFVVYCDRLSVTATGTVFLVNGNTKGDGNKVRLFEGAVVVRPNSDKGSAVTTTFENLLEPGQELVLATGKDIPYVHYFINGREKELFVKRKEPSGKELALRPSGWFEFRSQAVDDVFKTLEILYGTRISYDPAVVKNMFFIGRFEPEDSVEDILRSIALLNNLTIEKKSANHYVISQSR